MIALLAVAAVYTDVGEARACLPLDHGALVGTGGGLVEIHDDGAIGRVWTALDGLPGTRIETIAELGGQIWIGTDGGGARIAGDGFAEAFTSRDVRGFARLGDKVYAATWDGGVIDVHGGTAVPFRGAPLKGARARVAALAVVDGTLYAGTAAGLFALVHGKLERVPVDGVTAVAGLYAHAHTLWLATTDGLVARTGATVRHLGGGDLRAIAQLGDDLVVAGIADGLQKVDRGRLVAYAGPRELRIAESLASAHGGVCAGGLAGAWLARGTTWVHAAHREGPPSNDISALAVDGARLYVGTFDHGLATFEKGAWRTLESPELDARINAILVDGDRLWVGTAEGLTIIKRLEPAQATLGGPGFRDAARLTRRDGLASRSVLSLAKASTGILVGTSQGASLFADGHPVRLGPKAPAGSGQNIESIGNVWAIAEDRAGWLWLGTTTGLYRGHAGDTEWQRFSVVTGHLKDDWVIAMALKGDALYVGTYNGGIVRFDGTTATHVAEGWVNPGGLAVIGERIYAATQDGLRVTDDGTHWTDAGALPGRDTTAIARVGGTLIAGTRRGLAVLR